MRGRRSCSDTVSRLRPGQLYLLKHICSLFNLRLLLCFSYSMYSFPIFVPVGRKLVKAGHWTFPCPIPRRFLRSRPPFEEFLQSLAGLVALPAGATGSIPETLSEVTDRGLICGHQPLPTFSFLSLPPSCSLPWPDRYPFTPLSYHSLPSLLPQVRQFTTG